MPCYHPILAYRSSKKTANGKYGIIFTTEGAVGPPFPLPCGRCIGCRLEHSRQWAMRMMHEAQLHSENCFITLTFDERHLPADGSLSKKYFQDFMKRLRKRFSDHFVVGVDGKKRSSIRYFQAGEYGSLTGRPHFHAALFGLDFPDKRLYSRSGGNSLFTSAILESLWPFGFSSVGALTFDSAAYIARYITKKVSGPMAEQHYQRVDLETGEIFYLLPEFATMSLKPALGLGWYESFKDDVFPSDECIVNGRQVKPPRFYAKRLELDDPTEFARVKAARKRAAKKNLKNSSPVRLAAREEVKKAQISTFTKRKL